MHESFPTSHCSEGEAPPPLAQKACLSGALSLSTALRTHRVAELSCASPFGWSNSKRTGSHDQQRGFLLLRFLRRAPGYKNVRYSDNNWTSEAAQKGEFVRKKEVDSSDPGGVFHWLFFSSLKGFCQPGGRAETRRFTVSQGGSICGEVPEVSAQRLSHCHDMLSVR